MATSEKEQSELEIVERVEEVGKEQTAEVTGDTVNTVSDEVSQPKPDVTESDSTAAVQDNAAPVDKAVVGADKVDETPIKPAVEEKSDSQAVEATTTDKIAVEQSPATDVKESEIKAAEQPTAEEEIMEVDSIEIDEERKNLWISNLSSITKAADLKTLFQPFGKVVAAKIFTTRSADSPTCFGYVSMDSAKAALEAKKKYDRTNFKGKVLAIDTVARTPTSNQSRPAETPKPAVAALVEPTPVVEQPKPVVEQPTPVVEQPKPVVAETPKVEQPEIPSVPKVDARIKQEVIDDDIQIISPPYKPNEIPVKEPAVKNPPTKESSDKEQPAKAKESSSKAASEKSTEKKNPIKAPGSASKSKSHQGGSKGRSDKPSSSRATGRRSSPPRNAARINNRRSGNFNRNRPKDMYNKRELNREIKSVAARFSDGKRPPRRRPVSPSREIHNPRRPMNPSPFVRPNVVTGLAQQQAIYSQADVIRMVSNADTARKAREEAMERERARIAMELERERMEKQRLEILKDKQQLELQRMEMQLKQAQYDQQKALDQQQKYAQQKSATHSASNYSSAKDSGKQRYSSPQHRVVDNYRSSANISDNSRHHATRSRSPHRSASTRVDRVERKPEPTRYHESSSSRDRSSRRTDDYYDSRSSTRAPQKDQPSGYSVNSSSSYTKPAAQQQTHRYEAPSKDTSTVYEKRLAAMNSYGSGATVLNRLPASYDRDAYLDRKKDAYVSLSSRGDAYSSGGAALSYNPSDLSARYAANSSSYNRTLAPANDANRYEKIYQQTQSYSTPSQTVTAQQQNWGSTTASNAYDSLGTSWPRQLGTDYASGSTAYNVSNPNVQNVQYEYLTRRF